MYWLRVILMVQLVLAPQVSSQRILKSLMRSLQTCKTIASDMNKQPINTKSIMLLVSVGIGCQALRICCLNLNLKVRFSFCESVFIFIMLIINAATPKYLKVYLLIRKNNDNFPIQFKKSLKSHQMNIKSVDDDPIIEDLQLQPQFSIICIILQTLRNSISIKLIMNFVCILLTLIVTCFSNFNIDSFGAIADKDDIESQQANIKAIQSAVKAAYRELDKMVLIPNKTYYILPLTFTNLKGIAIYNRGTLVASQSVDNWPKEGKSFLSIMQFINCTDIDLFGGTIDGRGYHWWLLTLYDPHKKLGSQGNRPHLLKLQQCTEFRLSSLHLKNSPQFHILILDSLNLTIGQIKISVNRTAQYKLLKQFNRLSPPLFPFNTDGIDPQGSNIHIYNITCENYNDIVVVKPNSPKGRLSKCSENILVENVTSWWGSGMSIGTVAPGGDCVRNVTFRNVEMRHPFKGIYIKTYHGTNGTAVIENVVYENMQIVRPIYWSIYIGPHKDGPGCLHIDKCTPQPKVTIKDIYFKNITIYQTALYPYMIYCDSTNPCRNIVFQQVNAKNWLFGGKPNRCINAIVNQTSSTPLLDCNVQGDILN